MGSRRVSARRTLAVVAAVLAPPWLVFLFVVGLDEAEPVASAIACVLVAAVVAVPFAARRRRRRFGRLAGGLGLALLAVGQLGVLVGGLLLWPGAATFLLAAVAAPETTWRLGRVAVAVGAGVAACGVAAGAIAVINDVIDDPDLAVRLRRGASVQAFADRAIRDPLVTSAGFSTPAASGRVEVEI